MSQPVDVGAMLGGRYKVTGQVLVSADADYVFDGVDQILSRKVSILVPAAEHADDMAHHARQVAVGERNDPLQVLDLGRAEGHHYLVTNRASAAELLDLLLVEEEVEIDDADDARPFDVERADRPEGGTPGAPTESGPIAGYRAEDRDEDDRALESEIFDRSRDEPEDDTEDESDRAGAARGRGRWSLGRFGAGAAAGGAAGALASRGRGAAPQTESHDTADAVDTTSFDTVDTRARDEDTDHDDDGGTWDEPGYDDEGSYGDDDTRPREFDDQADLADRDDLDEASPRDRDDLDDRGTDDQDHDNGPGRDRRSGGAGVVTGGGVAAGAVAADRRNDDELDDELEEDDRENDPRFSRALVGILVVALIIAGVFFVYTQLGNLAGGGGTPAAQSSSAAPSSAAPSPTGAAAASSAPAAPAVPPRIVQVTREMKNNQYPDIASLDQLLPRLFDGNQATDWFSSTYSGANFAGLADNLALVMTLQQPTKVSRVDITQQGGQGGSFQIMVNSAPTIDGARQVAQGSFTSPDVSVPLPGGTPAAKYVIVNFTELPRINNGQYPYGLRISEIALS
ncbi:hypothetical protein GCM10011512_02120 [Tersicoccus solisilvae]|uniref:ABC transporter substrate-binding protein n=1 Tax=Tersicoccus solisilvae TaxID=1882339 RepID=A0ABQ1NJZ2_9MICC|nr:hypothetical protein [Tersicoccus solisilvae]GGC79060.1 hypothetical protein GCM10011512_02120 [Tersicoccus solisilvae]